MATAYSIIGGSVIAQQQVGAHAVAFTAEDIRRERTGIHARLRIMLDMTTLSWSTLNVERDEDRVRLVNAAWKHIAKAEAVRMSPFPDDYDQGVFKYDFDQFCEGLWNAKVGAEMAQPLAGERDPKPPIEIVPSFVIDGGGTILFGPPERGKSWVAMLMAVSIDAGVNTLWTVEQRPVLFINLERSAQSVANRLGAVNRALGLPPERPLMMMNRRGYSLVDIYSAAERSALTLGKGCCVFLDSVSRAGAGDLIANDTGNKIIDLMNRLADSWLAIAHTPRGDDSHIFGSQMFDGGIDIGIKTLGELRGDERAVGLLRTKGNDLPAMKDPDLIALRFNQQGLIGARKARVKDFPEILMSGQGESKVEIIRRYVGQVGTCSVGEISEATGVERPYIQRLVTESGLFIKAGKDGRDPVYGIAPDRWSNHVNS